MGGEGQEGEGVASWSLSCSDAPFPWRGLLALPGALWPGAMTPTGDFFCKERGLPGSWATPNGGVWYHTRPLKATEKELQRSRQVKR